MTRDFFGLVSGGGLVAWIAGGTRGARVLLLGGLIFAGGGWGGMSSSLPVTVYYLEMCERGDLRAGGVVDGLEVVRVEPADAGVNRRFYCEVGAGWEWGDRLGWSGEDWERYVGRAEVVTFVGRLDGVEIGYFEFEMQEGGDLEIVYFGLLPKFIGKGIGGGFLSAAVEFAWGIEGTERVWVHTCTRDHEHALGNYRARGFEVFRTEEG